MIFRLILLLFSLSTIAHWASAQNLNNIDYTLPPVIRNFSADEYNAHAQNWAVAQDKRGIVYFANNDGVVEYDGVSWRTIRTPSKYEVLAISNDELGRMYVGGVNEIGCLLPDSTGQMKYHSFVNYLPANERNFEPVRCIIATKDGVYYMTPERLMKVPFGVHNKINPKNIKIWKNENPEHFYHLIFSVNNQLYLRQKKVGFFRLINDVFEPVKGGEIAADKACFAILRYSDKKFLACFKQELFLMDETGFTPFKTGIDEFIANNNIYHASQLKDGHFAIATVSGGVVIIDNQGNLIQKINEQNGLLSNEVNYTFPDNAGVLWLALNHGISRVEAPAPFTKLELIAGKKRAVETIIKYNNKIYLATSLGVCYSEFLKEEDDISTLSFHQLEDIPSESWDFLPINNSLLVASLDGIMRIKDGKVDNILPETGFCFLHSKIDTNKVYIGSFKLTSIVNKNGTWAEEPIDSVPYEVRSIIETKDGALWIGTFSDGIIKVENINNKGEKVKLTKYGKENGIAEKDNFFFEVNNHYYLGNPNGLFKYNESNGIFEKANDFGVQYTNGKFGVYSILKDSKGHIIVSAYDKNQDYFTHINDIGKSIDSVSFLRLRRFAIRTMMNDSNDIIWVGGQKGIARYDPKITKNYKQKFYSLIRKVILNEDSVHFNGCFFDTNFVSNENQPEFMIPSFNYEHNEIRFESAAPFFDQNNEILYQYYLEGFDDKWSHWTSETYRIFTNLNEGYYIFHVRAKNIYGQVSEEATYAFRIKPPWYRTIGFYLSEIGFFVSLLLLSFYVNRTGTNTRVATVLTFTTLILIFEFFLTLVEPIMDRYSGGVPVAKLVMNFILSLMLHPIQQWLEKFLIKDAKKLSFSSKDAAKITYKE